MPLATKPTKELNKAQRQIPPLTNQVKQHILRICYQHHGYLPCSGGKLLLHDHRFPKKPKKLPANPSKYAQKGHDKEDTKKDLKKISSCIIKNEKEDAMSF